MTKKAAPNCGKCGLCLNVCPVYQQVKEEQTSPRAKMQLIKAHKEKSIHSSPYLKEIVSKCLMCGACAANCPSGIDHYTAFMKMREQMKEDIGESMSIRGMIYMLSKEHRLRLGTGMARTGQKLLPDKIARSLKLGNISANRMPELNRRPFRNACEQIIEPEAKLRGTVVYFTGCATNYLFDDTGFAAIGILKKMGFRIIIPKDQTCCGIPLLFHGAAKPAKKNIKANIRVFRDIEADAILVDCSTCGEALTHIYPSLFENHGTLSSDAKKIANKTIDVLTFIEQNRQYLDLNNTCNERPVVTYHAPCHSKNRLGIHLSAEKLIQTLPCVTYKKTADMEECCGGGGTFFYEYPKVAKKMMETKVDNVKAVGATVWLTDCPVCRINLGGNLKNKDKITVAHPLTMIHSALRPS